LSFTPFINYNMKKTSLLAIGLLACAGTMAQNPIVQTCFTTDPAPMVSGDRLYIYTGHDEDGADFFWMQEWRVYSTDDMANWTDHGSPLAIESFTWGDDRAWAPQCVERNGKFYFYVPLHSNLSGGMAIGVAVGDSPTGPFKDALGKPLYDDGKWDNIDPTVWIDGDKAYIIWGNPAIHYAELNDDMISFKTDVKILEQTEKGFGAKGSDDYAKDGDYKANYVEGPWLMKRGKLFYLLYAAGGLPENLDYSVSKKPFSDYQYKGTIMKAGPTNSFTNHVGYTNFAGHDYLFYHSGWLPNGGGFGRSVCVEEFQFNADGTFPLIEPTHEGVNPIKTYNPFKRNEMETMAWSVGVKTQQCDANGVYVCDIHNGDYIMLENVEFDKKAKSVTYTAASGLRGGSIEIHLDSISGPLVSTTLISGTGGWEVFKSFESKIEVETKGTHDVFFVFKGRKGPKLFNIDCWELK